MVLPSYVRRVILFSDIRNVHEKTTIQPLETLMDAPGGQKLPTLAKHFRALSAWLTLSRTPSHCINKMILINVNVIYLIKNTYMS